MVYKEQDLKKDEIYKSFKFRLLPTPKQEILLTKHFGCTRFIYNYFLTEKQKHYLTNQETLNFNKCAGHLVAKKKEINFEWLKEVNSQSLISALMCLETAYGNFFKKRCKFPRFKSKKHKNTFSVPQHVVLKNLNTVQIPKFKEGIKFVKHRDINGEIKSATISKSASGKYYISFLCVAKKPNTFKKTKKSIGIDLGIKDFLITSEGQRYCNFNFLKKYEKKLKRKQKILSRKQKESKGRNKARIAVAKIYEKIANSRSDMQHKISSKLIKDYDLIAIEDLNIKGMVQNSHLSKAISDVAWSSFVTKLKYKANWYGKEVIIIDRFFPSSKTCNVCNYIKEKLSLEKRSWTCPRCNTAHDRDVNAAKNILQRALTIQSSGTDDYRNGTKVRPKIVSKKAIKGVSDEVLKKKSLMIKAYEPCL